MPVNDYQTFACDPAANVESQAAYVSDSTRTLGEVSGRANSSRSNKVWRQGSMWSVALGMFLNDQGQDAIDDGVPANLMAKLKSAILSWVTSSITGLLNTNGQCRLTYSDATHIKLALFNGNQIKIGGTSVSLPNGGVLAANTNVYVGGVPGQNLAANVRYLVACYMQGAVPTLSFWPTPTYSHAPDTTAGNLGVEVIVGQPLHTLVGSVVTNASSQFTPDNGLGGAPAPINGVLTWFNRRTVSLASTNSSISFSSTTLAEVSTTLRATFQCWGDESILVIADGTRYNNPSSLNASDFLQIGVDSTSDLGSLGGGYVSESSGQSGQFESAFNGIVGEGIHFATLYGGVSSGSVGTIDQGYTRVHLRG